LEKNRSLEEKDPELASFFEDIARGRRPYGVRGIRSNQFLGVPVISYKIGRNEPCPCGSGKKYKRCCLK